jgi:methionyl-tRNA formyltransferase
MGTKNVGEKCLEILLKNNETLSGVVTLEKEENLGVVNLARKAGVPLFLNVDVNSQATLQKIVDVNVNVIFCVSYPEILKHEILYLAPLGCVNMHPSYLPENKGCYPTIWAILNDQKETGYTLHYMDDGIDTGDIIAQKKIQVHESDTGFSLYNRQVEYGIELFRETYKSILEGSNARIKQIQGQGEYHDNRLPNFGRINWNKEPRYIYNFVRALYHPKYECAFSFNGERKVEILQLEIVYEPIIKEEENEQFQPGKIVHIDKKGIIVKAGSEECVRLKKIKHNNEVVDVFHKCDFFRKGDQFT